MAKNIPQLNPVKKALLISGLCISTGINSQAQSITLYRTSVIVPPTFTTLSAAIAATLPGDSLVLSPSTFKENGLIINHDLKITGTSDTNGMTTIDAELKGRAILINAGQVALKSLAIINGKVKDGAGGGVCNYGTKPLLFSGNAKVMNCSVSGIFAKGGGIYSASRVDLTENTIVSNNTAQEEGGGVYAYSTFTMRGNAKLSNNKADGSGGGVFCEANGGVLVADFSSVNNNTALVAGGGIFGVGSIENQAVVSENKADFGGGIAGFNDIIFLRDTATITNNSATTSGGGIWLNNCALYGYDLFHITNNKVTSSGGTNFGGAIYNVNGSMLVSGGVIMGNQSPVSAIYNTSGSAPVNIRFNSTHFFNPKADGTRQAEIFNSPSLASSVINFNSDYCWWGQNDTTNLIADRPGTSSGKMTSYAMLTWLLNNGVAIDPMASSFPLSADFRLNDGTKMDSLTLRSIKGVFTANKGSFNSGTSYIDTLNYVRSVYKAPVGADSISVLAYVDADTFKSAKIAVFGVSNIAHKNTNTSIKVYPNPATENITIADAVTGTKINLYSIDGRLLQQKTSSNNIEQMNLSNIPNGTYILQLIDPSGQKASTKIIKQ